MSGNNFVGDGVPAHVLCGTGGAFRVASLPAPAGISGLISPDGAWPVGIGHRVSRACVVRCYLWLLTLALTGYWAQRLYSHTYHISWTSGQVSCGRRDGLRYSYTNRD